ncbi:hypothetical protein F5B21DRAFT_526436 [Xylaria acuta]|nr:hypothetical protein F5B21DRAFT_526436 [Xylaria acuta]
MSKDGRRAKLPGGDVERAEPGRGPRSTRYRYTLRATLLKGYIRTPNSCVNDAVPRDQVALRAARAALLTECSILLNNGANVNAQGELFDNVLQTASYKGYENIVQMLLNHDVNRNWYNGALQTAMGNGHSTIAEMLEKAINASTHAQSTQDDRQTFTDLTIQAACDTTNHPRSNKRSIEPESTIEAPQKRARSLYIL